ncbi:MAG: cobalamin B12-binding domain-containing protein [Planctomycetes bacterium]|nr:cobalamin B12-binding domain-containing protein [Planctomycetota bacterium]
MDEKSSEKAARAGGSNQPPLRILLAKPGLDGHDRGLKVIIQALIDAGMEVIYTGMRIPSQAVILAAEQEDADAVGVSNHSGAFRELFREVAAGLQAAEAAGRRRRILFCGGIIPPGDIPTLKSWGYRGVFPPGTSLEAIIDFLKAEAAALEKEGRP